jgi:8-oxo-dGTP pyrophosphatase MutT (NUDIX family)
MNKQEQNILKTIEKFARKLPKFPDGRINYSNSDTAPVATIFIKYRDKILLLKRSDEVREYKGKWNVVAGYLDEFKPFHEKILEEINEETGINESNILSIQFGKQYEFTDEKINKTWIIHPVLVELRNEPKIKLDWEHTEYKWIKPEELKIFDIVPELDKSWENIA